MPAFDVVNIAGHLLGMTLDGSAYHHGDLRAALLAEAAAMIDEGGTSSVTMRAIGRRLGVSRSAPYRHFADKSALLVAVAAAGFDRLRDRLEAVAAGAPGRGSSGSGRSVRSTYGSRWGTPGTIA